MVQACPCSFDKETTTSGPLITNNTIVMAMNAKADTLAEVAKPAIPKETNDDLTIVAGTREKRRMLDAYKRHFGSGYPDSIVTTRKGKQVSTASDSQLLNKCMRPSKDKFYRVETLELHCIIATLLNSLTPKSVPAGTKLVLFGRYVLNIYVGIVRYFLRLTKLSAPKSTYRHNAQIGEYCTILTSAKKIRF